MYLLYSLALSLVFLILTPYFVFQAARHGKYVASFLQRLGFVPEAPTPRSGAGTIWVHAVSVGEFLTALPLIRALRRELPSLNIAVSTTTLTGQRLARERLSGPDSAVSVLYFPFDWAFAVNRALNRINPSAVLILETELWPNFLRQCRRRGIAVALVNGRISPRSFSRYKLVRGFVKRVLCDLSMLVMQSEAEAERAKALGAVAERVRVCGNLKLDAVSVNAVEGIAQDPISLDLDRTFGLSDSRRLIVAGSTAPGEEEILLDAFAEIRRKPALGDIRLLIAPRHPERFDEVARLIGQSGFSIARRTVGNREAAPGNGNLADVLLLDTIGELVQAYRFASVVFVGGSLVNRGGHNIIEPAAFSKPIVVGPYTSNFQEIVAGFLAESAVVQIAQTGRERMASALTEQFASLLTDGTRAEELGSRATAFLSRSQGATRCTMDAICKLLGASGGSS